MDIVVRRVNSVDTNHGMALKYHTFILLSLDIIFFQEICSSDINLISNG